MPVATVLSADHFHSTKHHSNTGLSALTQGICTKAEQPSEGAWQSVQPSFSAPWQWLCNFSCLSGDELNWLPFQELQLPADATHNNKIGYELRIDMVCSWLQFRCKLRHQQHQHQLVRDSTIHPMFMASAACKFHIQGMNIIGLHDVINLRWPYPSGEDWSCTLCTFIVTCPLTQKLVWHVAMLKVDGSGKNTLTEETLQVVCVHIR